MLYVFMSGHSKWSKIKHTKGKKDVQKGDLFSKLSRLITFAVIEGGGITDADHNVRLRLAIEKAKSENLPKENIQRAIEKGTGPGKNLLHEVTYEGFGPGGVSLIIIATSDNGNKTLSEIRNVLERNGGKLGSQGSASYMFTKCGMTIIDKKQATENEIFQFADTIHAFDVDQDEVSFTIFFPYEELGRIKDHLQSLTPVSTEVDFKPSTVISIRDKHIASKIITLMNLLEELDDVHKVYSNFDIPDELIVELSI